MSVKSVLESIAEHIRHINGMDRKLKLVDMEYLLDWDYAETDRQGQLLSQALKAIEGKAAGSSGSGELSMEIVTVEPYESEDRVVLPSSGYDGMSKVVVEAIDTLYLDRSY